MPNMSTQDEDSGPVMIGINSPRPKGFPAAKSEQALFVYLKKYERHLYAQTAFRLIMEDVRNKATHAMPKWNEEIHIHPRIADAVGKRFSERHDSRSGYYPPWHLIHALSVFVDVELNARSAQYGYMVLATRDNTRRYLRYEIKGFDWANEESYWRQRTTR
jgi:hypothetical protein